VAEIEQWWPLRSIIFSAQQVKWLISFLPVLREGRWPPFPHTGYPQAPFGRRANRNGAPFESAAMVAAELDIRLKACGMDGWLVKMVYGWGENYQSLGLADQELCRRLNRCLKYVTGWKRKRVSYREFVNHRRSRRPLLAAPKAADNLPQTGPFPVQQHIAP